MEDILERIIAKKAERLEEAKRVRPLAELERSLAAGRRRASVTLREQLSRDGCVNVIAEVKRASPSKGMIREDLDPVDVGVAYAAAGAAGISVLTEEDFFLGSIETLRALGQRVDVPLLRKDFVFDEYQLVEAAEAGADAVLLIAAALERERLAALREAARGFGLEALVEVHTAREMEIVLDCGCDLVGVNNRSLRTFEVDLGISRELAALSPRSVILVCESGIDSRQTIDAMRAIGFRGFLIGEHLMRAPDPSQALRDLVR